MVDGCSSAGYPPFAEEPNLGCKIKVRFLFASVGFILEGRSLRDTKNTKSRNNYTGIHPNFIRKSILKNDHTGKPSCSITPIINHQLQTINYHLLPWKKFNCVKIWRNTVMRASTKFTDLSFVSMFNTKK